MLDAGSAKRFADEWIAAWNSHDLVRILSHYAEDFEMSSPVIRQMGIDPGGRLKGRDAVGAYWAKALQRTPGLRFELLATFLGVDSVVLHYRGPRGAAAEVFRFGADGKVTHAAAHYA